MARRGIAICLAATIMVLVLWGEAAAQSSDCTNTLISLSPCLDYITGNSSKPSSGCCSKLGTVVKSQPECLCQVLKGGGSSMGINVNQTQALALPGACDVKTPSISSCNGASPSGSPIPKTKSSGTGNVPSATGNGSSSDASTLTRMAAIPLLLILVFTSSYGSTH